MRVLAIDPGHYSVKFLVSQVDRKSITHLVHGEEVIKKIIDKHPSWNLIDCTNYIVDEIIKDYANSETRIISTIPLEIVTTRFLNLPVKNKKKAELMIPFQLEEDIPFTLSESHYAYKLEAQENGHMALVALSKEDTFAHYYERLKENNCLPDILTSEPSIYDTYFATSGIAGPFCVLDIGHKASKAYFFYNSKLISTHISFMGGRNINEMIAKTYQLSEEESVDYKHKNAFVLTKNQLSQVGEAQKEFAVLMDHVFKILVSDFQRWELGFRVNYGLRISKLYITGGTSNISNLCDYLAEKFEVKVEPLETFEHTRSKSKISKQEKAIYCQSNLMAHAYRNKKNIINLLTGRFTQFSNSSFPIESLTFLMTRSISFALFLLVALSAQRFMLDKEVSSINRRLQSLTKNSALELTPRQRRTITSQPKQVLKALTQKQKIITQQISYVQSAVKIDSLSPLSTLSNLINQNKEITLINYECNDLGDVVAEFKSDSVKQLENLKEKLKLSEFSSGNITLDPNKKILTLKALGY